MNKFLFSIVFFSFISFVAFAQKGKDNNSRIKNGEDLNVQYHNEASIGIFVHSAGGLGLSYRRGYQVTAKRKRMFEIEAQNFKHQKEVKSVSPLAENAKGYVYGKLNSFFIIRPGVGYQHVLYQKSDKKSVEIRYSYFLGATLNFAKPVYLEIERDPNTKTISTERYDPEIHNQGNIYGKAPFTAGLEHTTIYPGGYAKFALSFDYANRYNGVKAIETGVLVDVYPTVLPMMAYNTNQQAFVEVYLKLIFGKKWF